jgi:hypothetical protein
MTTTEIQTALQILGYAPGPVDGIIGNKTKDAIEAFQRASGLPVDGIAGPMTRAALTVALGSRPGASTALIPQAWLPNVKMKGIVFHWSAGAHIASGLDKAHYHIIIEGSGNLVLGRSIADNLPPLVSGGYAAHTRGHNSSIIGVSLACMAGAKESPFSAGSAPMTKTQWNRLPIVLADLCRFYGIKPTREAVLSHAEVQKTLGIKQNGKWDITWAPGFSKPGSAIEIGDQVRAAVAKLI